MFKEVYTAKIVDGCISVSKYWLARQSTQKYYLRSVEHNPNTEFGCSVKEFNIFDTPEAASFFAVQMYIKSMAETQMHLVWLLENKKWKING